jgi:hypothetical protein
MVFTFYIYRIKGRTVLLWSIQSTTALEKWLEILPQWQIYLSLYEQCMEVKSNESEIESLPELLLLQYLNRVCLYNWWDGVLASRPTLSENGRMRLAVCMEAVSCFIRVQLPNKVVAVNENCQLMPFQQYVSLRQKLLSSGARLVCFYSLSAVGDVGSSLGSCSQSTFYMLGLFDLQDEQFHRHILSRNELSKSDSPVLRFSDLISSPQQFFGNVQSSHLSRYSPRSKKTFNILNVKNILNQCVPRGSICRDIDTPDYMQRCVIFSLVDIEFSMASISLDDLYAIEDASSKTPYYRKQTAEFMKWMATMYKMSKRVEALQPHDKRR